MIKIENKTDAILNIDSFEYDATTDKILAFPMFGRSDEDEAPDDKKPYAVISFDESGNPVVERLEHDVVADDIEIEVIKDLYDACFNEDTSDPYEVTQKMTDYINISFNVLL